MDRLLQDLKYAARVLIKDRAFTATVTLTLAICIGANVGIFAIVNSVLLQPLPVPQAGQLVHMYNAYPGAGVEAGAGSTGVPDYDDRLREIRPMQARVDQSLTSRRTPMLLGTLRSRINDPDMITFLAA